MRGVLLSLCLLFVLSVSGQNVLLKGVIYPQLKSIETKNVDYNALLGNYKSPKKFKITYQKRPANDLIDFVDCVEGNCSEGKGKYLYVESQKPIKTNESEAQKLKERIELCVEKYEASYKKNKKFNPNKYGIPYHDKLKEYDQIEVTYALLDGQFSEAGKTFKGKKYVYVVVYERNNTTFTPQTKVDFTNTKAELLAYEGEMKRNFMKHYDFHGLGRNHLMEKDETIERVIGLYGESEPKILSINYVPGHDIKSFTGIPSRAFFKKDEESISSISGYYIFGKMVFEDGLEYIGGLLNDKYNGIGRLKNPDGTIQEGLWVQDELKQEQKVEFPAVFSVEDFTNLDYSVINLRADGYKDNLEQFFYFGDLKNGLPDGLGLYLYSSTWTQCFIGELHKGIPGKSYFYYYNYEDQFKSGIQLTNDTWYGTVFSRKSMWDVAHNHFKLGEMQPDKDKTDVYSADPNISYGSSCIEVLPNNEKEVKGYFQYPDGWYQTTNNTFKYLTNKQHKRKYIRYYDAEETDFVQKIEKKYLKNMYDNNTFCGPNMNLEKKMAIIKNQEELHATSEKVKMEMAAFAAKQEAAQKAFNDCWKPDIYLSGDPSKTYTYCNGHKTFGEKRPVSQIKAGDVVQYKGILYEVQNSYYGGLKLYCDLSVSGSSFYVFDKLKKAGDELRNYCDCSGYKYVTKSTQVPTSGYSVAYQSSTVTLVRQHTETRSYTYRVKTDCKKECGGRMCWPSGYAGAR